jgi:hypothetical protein
MRLTKLLFWLTPPLLVLAIYGPTLSLPFYWDDLPLLQAMFGKTMAQIWSTGLGLPYYRPSGFALWRLTETLFGPTNPAPFRAINLIALVISSWLVGLLAKQLTTREPDLTAWLASTLMSIFPFNNQAVPAVNNLFHLLITPTALGACLCLLKFAQNGKVPWAVASVALAAISPFGHESGLTSAGLIAVCYAAYLLRQKITLADLKTNRSYAALVVITAALLANVAYLPWWVNVPKSRVVDETLWVGLQNAALNSVFFLEGLTFPTQFLAGAVMNFGLPNNWAVGILGIATLAFAWVIGQNWRWLAFGLIYCYVAALPAMLTLIYPYVLTSTRLMVYASPAAAILWSAMIVEGVHRFEKLLPRVRAGVAILAVVAIGIVPIIHLMREVRLHHLALDPLWTFVDDARTHPAKKLLVVNATDWIAPVRPTYALGFEGEGVIVVPSYTDMPTAAWVHTRATYDVEAVTFPLIFPQLNDIYFTTWGKDLDWQVMAERVRAAGHVAIVQYADDSIQYLNVGNVGPASGEALVSFEDRIWLTAAEASLAGQTIELRLSWRVNATSGEDIFANALDCAGDVAGLSGGAGMGGIYPVWLWQAGESIHEVRRIPLTAPSPDGCYRIEIGLFNPQTGTRTEARDANGERLANDSVVIELTP